MATLTCDLSGLTNDHRPCATETTLMTNLCTIGFCIISTLAPGMMWRNIFDRRLKPTSAGGTPNSADILEESEAAAFEQAAREIRNRKQTSPEPGEKVDPVHWQEQSDVYVPEKIEAAALAHRLAIHARISISRGHHAVFIHEATVAKFRNHLASNTTVELGGLLTGKACYDPALDSYLIAVEDYIAAQGGKETPISFEYTADTWNQLYPKLKELAPGVTVVGSCHSHPGLGVFLSTTDIDTQTSVFSQEWQIAIVHDPIKDDTGYFISQQGIPVEQVIIYA